MAENKLYAKPRDGQKMLDLIVQNSWHDFYKGKSLWTYIEKRCLLEPEIGRRTWQSMKEHFIKVVILSIEMKPCLFKLSRWDAERLLRTKNRSIRDQRVFRATEFHRVHGIDQERVLDCQKANKREKERERAQKTRR